MFGFGALPVELGDRGVAQQSGNVRLQGSHVARVARVEFDGVKSEVPTHKVRGGGLTHAWRAK